MDEQAPLNAALEDYLAIGGTAQEHDMMLRAWLLLGAEYMARVSGRKAAAEFVGGLHRVLLAREGE